MTRPSQSPGRRPRLRHRLHRLAIALVAIALVATGIPVGSQVAVADESTDLVALVNRDRAANSLPSLVSNPQLNAVAKRWAERMAADNRMYHNPSLSSQVPGGWQRLGENVATGHRSPAEMQQAWMNSSGHRANILGNYNSVGTAFVRVNGKTWGVQVFATYPGVVAGPSAGVKAISAAWADAGGKSGAWGNRLAAPACVASSTCGHVFEKVIAYWQSGKGIILASGSIAQWARSQGVTTTGYPNSQPVSVAKNGGGTAQSFTKVLVNAGPSGIFALSGAIRDAHGKAGGVAGSLGWPTGAQICGLAKGGCSQAFQNATIYLAGGAARFVAAGPVATFYQSSGGPAGVLGYPTSNSIPVAANGGGTAQAFTGGLVNAGPAGAFLMTGAIRDAHGKAGGVAGSLGWPTGAQTCGLAKGGCSQAFQKGTVYAVNGAARFVSAGPVATFYQSSGGPAGVLGYPTSNSIPVAANGGGTAQAFTGGLVNAGPAGAFLMTGAIRDAHGKAGGVAGSLGWPTAAQTCGLPDGGCSQTFQKGTITVNAAGVATISR